MSDLNICNWDKIKRNWGSIKNPMQGSVIIKINSISLFLISLNKDKYRVTNIPVPNKMATILLFINMQAYTVLNQIHTYIYVFVIQNEYSEYLASFHKKQGFSGLVLDSKFRKTPCYKNENPPKFASLRGIAGTIGSEAGLNLICDLIILILFKF